MKKSIVLMAIVASFGAYGCGTTCEDLCEDRKACDNASADEKAVDCAKSCEEDDKFAEDTKCTEQYEALLDCGGEQDVCTESANGKCDTEAKDYIACTLAACIATPSLCE